MVMMRRRRRRKRRRRMMMIKMMMMLMIVMLIVMMMTTTMMATKTITMMMHGWRTSVQLSHISYGPINHAHSPRLLTYSPVWGAPERQAAPSPRKIWGLVYFSLSLSFSNVRPGILPSDVHPTTTRTDLGTFPAASKFHLSWL